MSIRKSPNDDREYRHVTLSNGLQVCLVSDPTTDKAAASMDVNVGVRFLFSHHITRHSFFLLSFSIFFNNKYMMYNIFLY
jgi:hypothetical protein